MGFKEVKPKEKKNIMEGKVACPNCGSMDTIVSNVSVALLIMGSLFCFLAAGIAIWIPLIGWVLAPIFIIGSIVCFIGGIINLFFIRFTFYCKSCEKKYKIGKAEYIKLSKGN